MSAGRYTDILEFERNIGASDGAGGYLEKWEVAEQIWGKEIKNNQSFGERIDQETAWNTITLETRYSEAINPGQRVYFHGEHYEVKNVKDPFNRRNILHIVCLKKSYEN